MKRQLLFSLLLAVLVMSVAFADTGPKKDPAKFKVEQQQQMQTVLAETPSVVNDVMISQSDQVLVNNVVELTAQQPICQEVQITPSDIVVAIATDNQPHNTMNVANVAEKEDANTDSVANKDALAQSYPEVYVQTDIVSANNAMTNDNGASYSPINLGIPPVQLE
ncbi:MAG: hypothetical protein WDN09_02545 [bacterium]